MSQRNHGLLSSLVVSALLALTALVGCGGGGSSSSSSSNLPQNSIPPSVTLQGWTPNDAQLTQYKTYTFSASATDPNIGGTITEFQWDFGDGTTQVTTVSGKTTDSVAHTYTASGTPTLSVVAKNAAGLLSPAATQSLTVNAGTSPLTVSFTAPTAALSINPPLGGTYDVTFDILVVNTGTGTISASGVLLNSGNPGSTQAAPLDLGGGKWRVVVTYPAATALGSADFTPTVAVQDSNGVASATVTGPTITIKTVSLLNDPPQITMVATPKIVAGVNSTWQNVAIDFKATAVDPNGDTLTYSWTFGDTANAGDVAPTQSASALAQTHTYAAAGIYPVVFTANDGRAGGVKSIPMNLNILANAPPTLTVAVTPAGQPYANVPLTFTATVTDADGDTPAISWDFGDTTSGTGGSVIHSFLGAGTTVVTAKADDGKGGVTTQSLTLDVLTNFPPVSKVTTPSANLYQNKAYTFTATATDPDAGNTITEYQWNFGDGSAIQSSAVNTASHTYASTYTGTAQVKVRAVDNHGSTGDFSPAVGFPVVATSLPVGTFLNPAGAASYNTETGAAGVTVTYIVSMTNPNGTGFLPITALTFNTGESAATATLLSSVDNGNGTYTYQVQYKPSTVGPRLAMPSIVGMDAMGITGLVKTGGPVTINTQATNNPPVATFTSTPDIAAGANSSYPGVSITFNGKATDPDSDPLTYSIAFGDGTTIAKSAVPAGGTLPSVQHVYASAGTYSAVLSVDDGRTGGLKTVTLSMNILANSAPTVGVTWVDPKGNANPVNTYANLPLTFTAAVADANGDTVNLTWDFGDGTAQVKGTGLTQTHTFPAVGSTKLVVTADDGKGNAGTTPTWTTTLNVQANHAPVAAMTTATATLNQNKSYTFAASATDPDSADTIDHYEWNFADGTAITNSAGGATTTTTHVYASAATFAVKVRAVDNHGTVGDYSPVVNFLVQSTTNPVVAFTSPAATVSLDPGATINQDILFTVTNPNVGLGAIDPLPEAGISFSANDASATLQSVTNMGGTSYKATVRYAAAASAGSRVSTPSASAQDSLGVPNAPVAALGNLLTVVTGTFGKPSITVTAPAASSSTAYTLANVTLGFTVTNPAANPTTYSVDWGDATTNPPTALTGASLTTGIAVSLTHAYQTAGSFTVTIAASDNRSSNNTAVAQYRTFVVSNNAYPTASITSPQASATLPALIDSQFPATPVINLSPATTDPSVVVIPLNGKLNFAGTSTGPSTGNYQAQWTFQGGVPSVFTGDTPGEVVFPGQAGKIVAYLITFKAKDDFNRFSSDAPGITANTYEKWVVVDGVNTQNFNLNFKYRLKRDDNGTISLTTVKLAANGLGANVQIFQDGANNTYKVQDAQGINAAIALPVRSNLPFYIKIPSFGADSNGYMMRIPNAPSTATGDPALGKYSDDILGTVLDPSATVSNFGFASTTTSPWDPTLNIVTAQGFAAENAAASQRKLNGNTDLVLGTVPVNERWLDRLSVPSTDSGAIPWSKSNNSDGQLSGIPAYQLFAEWPTLLLTRKAADLADGDVTTTAGTQANLGFVLDYPKYSGDTQASETFAAFSMQAFRVPAGVTDPYQLSPAWQSASAELDNTAVNPHAGLNPLPVAGAVTAFLDSLINTSPGATPLAGGIKDLALPYDPNDPNRIPLIAPNTRGYASIRQVFSYSEYLWSTVWARPLVLNSARPKYSTAPAAFPSFRYSNPAAWPKASGISPDNSSFDLTVRGGGVGAFDGVAPVKVGGAAPATGVGRFFWTAFTPSYSGDANPGAAIARTWLADDGTKQIPLTNTGSATGDATAAFGFMTPQDTIVDKRGRKADGSLNGNSLGGYRVTWFNPTKDQTGNPVAPDFWVVELKEGTETKHFMLPASYPTAAQSVTDLILTDARTYLPSGNAASAGPATVSGLVTDKVGPGYCWFDVPSELRPTAGATLTVFAVKAILKNHPVNNVGVMVARPLNRPDWIDAIKTATANMKMLTSSGTDLTYAYKVPFNFAWDIVVASGPQTAVAP